MLTCRLKKKNIEVKSKTDIMKTRIRKILTNIRPFKVVD